jgi:hypothetical protein
VRSDLSNAGDLTQLAGSSRSLTVTMFVNGNLNTGGSFGGIVTLTLYMKS